MTNVAAIQIERELRWRLGHILLCEDNILRFKPALNIEQITIADLKELVNVLTDFTNGIPRPYLSDGSEIAASICKESGFFIGEHAHEFATAVALTERHPLTRFMAHSAMYLKKPNVPIKVFKTENEAIGWLKRTDF